MGSPGFGSLVGLFAEGYLAVGAAFALLFQWRGLVRLDPAARGGTPGFRLVILPGLVALWPVLLALWLRAARGGRP